MSSNLAGGTVNFGNDSQSYVYDVDGTTRLPSGSTYLAQLYAGPGPDSLRPVGGTTPIAPIAGLFTGGTRVIPTVSGGQLASVQVRVWESAKGSTYEQALGERGKTGASAILQVLTGNPNQVPPTLPTPLTGLQSFSLSIGPPATPPEITTQPQSQTVSLGAKGNLAVVASGGAPLHYQWRFNGSNLEKATAATFAVTNAQPGNAGGYTVVVSNSGGSVTSEVATVTVMIDRTLALISPPAKHEGEIVPVPIELIGKGDIGGITLLVHYDPDFLSAPEVSWGAVLDDALKLANVPVLGELRLVFAFPLGAVPEGTQSLATVNFRARTVQANATTDLNLQVIDVSNPDGSTLRFGTEVLSGQATVLARGGGGTGDNNGNNRLDVGDVTLVLRLLAQLDTIRPWDVTRNDLNGNGSIDSGDAVKILRGAAEIGNPVPPPPDAASAKALAAPPAGSAVLSPLRLGGTAGQLVTAFVRLQNLPTPISGAAFTLHYPANALRLVNAQSHRTGALVPGNALAVWNVAPSGNNYAGQSGQIRLAASSATPWASQDGILAELTFEVQAAAAGQYLWPLSLTAVEVSQNGFDNQILPTSGSSFVGREPVPGSLGTTRYTASGQFEMIFSGDAGARYAIEATTDFVAWTLLQNVLSPEGAVSIVDPNAGQFPRRFYRAKAVGN